METDWEIEIGGDAPIIDACWSGFLDLRLAPERAIELSEVQALPAIGALLVKLNAPGSPVFTLKCDVWVAEAIDPLEYDASIEESAQALACYIDLMPRSPQLWSDPDTAIQWCKRLCAALRTISLRASRIDLVIRRAIKTPDVNDIIAVTAYLSACGLTAESAKERLATALAAFADSVLTVAGEGHRESKLQ